MGPESTRKSHPTSPYHGKKLKNMGNYTVQHNQSWETNLVRVRNIKTSHLSCPLVLLCNSPAIDLMYQLHKQGMQVIFLFPHLSSWSCYCSATTSTLSALTKLTSSILLAKYKIFALILLDVSVHLGLLAIPSLKLNFPWPGFSFIGPLTL